MAGFTSSIRQFAVKEIVRAEWFGQMLYGQGDAYAGVGQLVCVNSRLP